MDLPADRMVLRAGTLDLAERVFVRLDGGRSPLTEREVSLVRLLAALEGRTVPRADLLHRLWPAEVTPRVIDTAVARLRAKVEVDRHRPDHLVTAFGDGYRWVANLAAVAPLPAEPELFLGRAGEIEALRARLGAGGAVTSVVGAPGLGKTRLALRLAHELRTAWPGGAVFVELAEVRHGATVDRHVASALRLEASAPEALTAAFAGRGATLLVLDDCDAVQDAVRARVAAWRGAQPALRVVVTSRIALGLPDEIVVALDPLPHDAAAALFLQRAERHGAPWIDDPRARDQIPALVEGLERNALAIELAAGRASALGPQQLLQRLTDRFRLLRSRERGASPRHRTLDAALDVSWQLLDGARQRQIAALSVFRGGFDAEAARAVAGDVDPSDGALVVARGGRYTSYQFVREYAAARLAEAPDREREAIGRHVEHFASRARRDPPEALVADEANLEVAVERAIALGRPDLAAPLAVAWFEVVNRSGPLDLVIAPLRRVLERTASPAVARALGSSLLATGASEEAWQVLTRALEGGGDPRIEALVHLDLANLHRSAGRPEEARASAEAALAAARAAGDAGAEGLAHGTLATLDQVGGRPDAALRRYELALERHVLVGDRRAEGRTAANLGSLALGLGRLEEARRRLTEALAVHREVGDRPAEARTLSNLGALHAGQGAVGEARRCFEAASVLCRAIGDRRTEAVLLNNLAALELREGHLAEARRLVGAALALHRAQANATSTATALRNLAVVCEHLGDLEDVRGYAEEALAISHAAGARSNEACCLGVLGTVDHHRDVWARGHARFEQALTMLEGQASPREEAQVRIRYGDALVDRGALDLADAQYTAALARARDSGDRTVEVQALVGIGGVALARGACDRARLVARRALALARPITRLGTGQALLLLGEVARCAGHRSASRAALTQAEPLVAPAVRAELWLARARLELDGGDREAAIAALRAARAVGPDGPAMRRISALWDTLHAPA